MAQGLERNSTLTHVSIYTMGEVADGGLGTMARMLETNRVLESLNLHFSEDGPESHFDLAAAMEANVTLKNLRLGGSVYVHGHDAWLRRNRELLEQWRALAAVARDPAPAAFRGVWGGRELWSSVFAWFLPPRCTVVPRWGAGAAEAGVAAGRKRKRS